jgi:hypothetical protein
MLFSAELSWAWVIMPSARIRSPTQLGDHIRHPIFQGCVAQVKSGLFLGPDPE